MLPGIDELFATAVYLVEYYLGLFLWSVARVTLSMSLLIQSVQTSLVENISDLVQYTVNALAAPVGLFLVLALTTLGAWYVINNLVATSKWVDPSRLLTYGLATLVFFSTPVLVIDLLESVRTSMTQGIEATLLDETIADMFNIETGGDDEPLPDVIPDVNGDGHIGTFDLVAYFLSVANSQEIFNSDFPAGLAAAYFPEHPSEIDLSNEDARNQAIENAWTGITRLAFSFPAILTAVAEHLLWLVLTMAAVLLYIGFPFAAMLSFFVYTDALFTSYIRQFIKLCIETFISVIIVAFVVGLIAAAAQASIGLYVGTSLVGLLILTWRIKGAFKLSTAAFDMVAGGNLTGGSSMRDLRVMSAGVTRTAATAGMAALTGGTALAAAGMLAADQKLSSQAGMEEYTMLGLDQSKSEARTQQLLSLAGYSIGRNPTARHGIETAHEGRAFLRAMRDGGPQAQTPDTLDYLRVGSSLSTFGSTPWLALRTSPSLRHAFDTIGGNRGRYPANADDGAPNNGVGGHTLGGPTSGGELTAILQQLTAVLQGFQAQGQPQPPVNGASPVHAAASQPGNTASQPPPGHQPATGRHHAESSRPPARHPAGQAGPVEVNIVSSRPDQDGNLPANRDEGQVILQPQTADRTASLVETVSHLQNPASLQGQESYQVLLVYTGKQNADALQQAVRQHGPEVVQDATQATVDVIADYTQTGLNPAEILAAFQHGDGFTAVRQQLGANNPLTHTQLTAVADLALLPRREVTPAELTHQISTAVTTGGSDRTVAAALGAPTHFGPHTRAIRGVMAGAQELGLTAAQTEQVLSDIRHGLLEEVRVALSRAGGSPTMVNNFIADASMLPATRFQIAQSASPRSPQEDSSA
ncbi:MAG: hypothetical protein KF770_31770 [Anaerolineae bacterium]|nr:hypothetical protein [Anaerolineae bacterium]